MSSYVKIAEKKRNYPWLVFKLLDGLYAVNSSKISSIMIMPNIITKLPDMMNCILGVIEQRGSIVPLIDLRILFNMKSLSNEFDEFKTMIEQRKNDHIHWVNELENSVNNGTKFNLATNPHECAFGKWYDNFTSDLNNVNFHMKKIDEPHKALHKAAEDVMKCSQDCVNCKREECLKSILERVKSIHIKTIEKLLDETKEVFKQSYKEMVIILENEQNYVGIVVDAVLSVENLNEVTDIDEKIDIGNGKFITGIYRSDGTEGLILTVDEDKVMNIVNIWNK